MSFTYYDKNTLYDEINKTVWVNDYGNVNVLAHNLINTFENVID